MPIIRPAEYADAAQIAAIQNDSPEAAQWEPGAGFGHEVLVSVSGGQVAGFLAGRTVAQDEHEILNLAVLAGFRRQGIASGLLRAWLGTHAGAVYLEVRESNLAARNLYKSMGFQEVNLRPKYYDAPLEAAIVLKFHSC